MSQSNSSFKPLEHQLFLSLSQDLLVVFDDAYRFETVSDSCRTILGYLPDELIGKPYFEFLHPEDINSTKSETKSIAKGKSTLSFENRYIHKNGSTVYLQWSSAYDDDSKKYISVARNITAVKRNELQEKIANEINTALINGTDNLVWSLDRNYCFTGFNSAFKASREEDYQAKIEIGANTFESTNFSEEVIKEWKQIYEQVFNGKSLDFEYDTSQIETHREAIKWHKIELKPIVLNNEIIGLLGSSVDITDIKKAAIALSERNALIESVIKEIPMGVAVNEIDTGNALFVNEQFSRTYNWPAEDLKDVESFLQKIYPKDSDTAQNTLKQIVSDIKSGDPARMVWDNIPIQGQDRKTRYVNAKNIPLFDQNLMISTVTDNTALYLNKLALEASSLEREEILESISDAFYTIDENYNFTYLNKHSLEKMDMPEEQLLGKNLFEVYPELKNTIFYTKLKEARESKENAQFEFYHEHYGIWFDQRIYKTPTGFSVFYVDITIKKNFEIELQQFNKMLQEKNTELEQFAFVASHDLQEPLRIISSFMDLLKKQYHDKLDETALKYINFSIEGGYRMKQIITDLLEYSRIGSSETTKEAIDCNQVMSEVLSFLEATIAEKNAEIKLPGLPKINYNKTAFKQIMINIISNALKYVKKDVAPEITINYIDDKSYYRFMVKDNGIGIHEKYHDQIFSIFKRLHNRSDYEGNGMGLSICKKIIEKHGGVVDLKSEEGKGSTFSFTVPK